MALVYLANVFFLFFLNLPCCKLICLLDDMIKWKSLFLYLGNWWRIQLLSNSRSDQVKNKDIHQFNSFPTLKFIHQLLDKLCFSPDSKLFSNHINSLKSIEFLEESQAFRVFGSNILHSTYQVYYLPSNV